MKNADGSVIVYKGSKCFDRGRGEKVTLRAKIKSHGERDGVAQTVIERPKLL